MKTQQIGDAGWVEEVVLFNSKEQHIGTYYGYKINEAQALIVREDITTFEAAVIELLRAYNELTMLKIRNKVDTSPPLEA